MSLFTTQAVSSPRAVTRAELNNINAAQPPVPLLAWWRELPITWMGAAHDRAIGRTLGNVVLSGQPHWQDAIKVDAAACIGLALSLLPLSEPTTRADLIMAALLRCAIAGGAAAALVLAQARKSYRLQAKTHSVSVTNGDGHQSSPIVTTDSHHGSSGIRS
jgi:hypothetical protein